MTNENSSDGKFQDALSKLTLTNDQLNDILELVESLKRDFYLMYKKCPENIYTLWFLPNFGVDLNKQNDTAKRI